MVRGRACNIARSSSTSRMCTVSIPTISSSRACTETSRTMLVNKHCSGCSQLYKYTSQVTYEESIDSLLPYLCSKSSVNFVCFSRHNKVVAVQPSYLMCPPRYTDLSPLGQYGGMMPFLLCYLSYFIGKS